MIGLTRLICEVQRSRQGQRTRPEGGERKVFDVPPSEAAHLKRRLEAAGWTVTVISL